MEVNKTLRDARERERERASERERERGREREIKKAIQISGVYLYDAVHARVYRI